MSQSVTARYAENLPGDNYKTRRYEAELSTTVETDAEVPAATERLFLIAKAQVQSQIARSSADLALHQNQSVPVQQPRPQPQPQYHQPVQQFQPQPPQRQQQQTFPPRNNSAPRQASSKQIAYIQRLAKEQGYTPDQIRMLPRDYYNVQSFNELSSDEASSVIESLNSQRKAA